MNELYIKVIDVLKNSSVIGYQRAALECCQDNRAAMFAGEGVPLL